MSSTHAGPKGKQYSLVMLLVVIFLAKLVGKDKPDEIADWAKNNAEELAKLLKLKRTWMPSHSTIRRVFQSTLNEAEFIGRPRNTVNKSRQEQGKFWQWMAKRCGARGFAEQERSDHVLSIYEVQDQQVVAQEAVDSKENEIVAAPRVLEQVLWPEKSSLAMRCTPKGPSLSRLWLAGDYLWPVKENQPRLYEDIQRLFAPDNPKPGFGKISTDFLTATKVNLATAGLKSAPSKPVLCSMITSTGPELVRSIG